MLAEAIRAIYTKNLGIKRTESVLVFTDRIREGEVLDVTEQCRRERLRDIAILTAEVGKAFTKRVSFHEYPATMAHGAEPPEELWRLAFGQRAVDRLIREGLLMPLLTKEITDGEIKGAEAIIRKYRDFCIDAVIALSNYSTSHTRFRDLLTRMCGTRYASMPLFDVSMLEGAMDVDWRALSMRTKQIAQMVNRADYIEMETSNGSILSFSKRGRRAEADTGILTRPGSFGNLPAGEVYLAPMEGTAEGRLILEWAPTREMRSPVTLAIKDGIVIKVEGDEPYAGVLRARLAERKENANIAEFGIGTNDKARRPDNILESEKILGTIHVALGDNSSFGGRIRTPFHQDFVFFKPTVMLIHKDGAREILMKDGKFEEKI